MREFAIAIAAALLGSGCAEEPPAKRASAAGGASPPVASPAATAADTADGEDSDSAAWYDAAPLRASLRSEALSYGDPSSDVPLYDMDLSLEAGGKAFVLEETVWFTEREGLPLDDVALRLYANAPRSLIKRGAPVKFVEGRCEGRVRCTVSSPAPSVIDVDFRRPLPPHGRVRVHVKLTGVLDRIDSSRTTMLAQSLESMAGMLGGGGDNGGGNYGTLAVGDDITSLGGFYAVVARRRGGRWERQEAGLEGDLGPDAISNVRLGIALDPGFDLAVPGAVVADKTTKEDGVSRRRVTLAAGMVREIALIASPSFEVASSDVNGVRVRSHFLSQEPAAGKKVLDAAVHSLTDYERRFGPYPYRNLDIAEAAVVGGAGGIEFSGLATVASMFYRPAGSGALASVMDLMGSSSGGIGGSTDEMREFVVAHEVAHQWWHGLVGSDSRQHPFADESLAQFSSMLYFEDRYGAERGRCAGDMNVKANYQTMRLMGVPDGPVDRPAAGTAAMAYAGLVYGKGPYFYVQLRKQLGEAVFFAVLREYVQRFRFGFAGPDDFTEIAASHAGPNATKVRALAYRWLEGIHGDEDLGQANLGSLLGGLSGGGDENAPNAALMKKLLQSLGGPGDPTGDAGPLKGLLDGLLR